MITVIALLVRGFLLVRNPFSSKKFACARVGNILFIYRINQEIVIFDYYQYVLGLLQAEGNQEQFLIVQLDTLRFKWFSNFAPILSIGLQIEHTLIKKGTRGSEQAIAQGLPFHDGRSRYLVRIQNLQELIRSNRIIDYSRINLKQIKFASPPLSGDYLKKNYCISPSLFAINQASIFNLQQRTGTITTFGNPSESRRAKFLNALLIRGIPVENITGNYLDIESCYRSIRILVNIRQTEGHDTLEELRILPALRCGVIVINEEAPYQQWCRYSDFILSAPIENLPNLIQDVQNHYVKYHARIFTPAFFTRMARLERTNLLIAKRILQ